MTVGNANSSDNFHISGPADSGLSWQSQADMAGQRFAAEANMQVSPLSAMRSDRTLPTAESSLTGDATGFKPGDSPQITIVTASDDGKQTPNFIVKQDGTVENLNPVVDKNNIIIEVEGIAGGAPIANSDQQKSVDDLVNNIYKREALIDPSVAESGLKLNDRHGLVSDDIASRVGIKPTPANPDNAIDDRQNFAAPTQDAMSDADSFSPGSSGSMSRADVDHLVPERAEPRVRDENQSVADIKNAIAANFRPDAATAVDKNAPYETSRNDKVGNAEMPAVGRYGMTYPIIGGWFANNFDGDDDFSDDNISGKMDALAKKGKVSKSYAAKFHDKAFAHRFVTAMHELKAGHVLSKHDVKDLLPPALQEQIAADIVGKFSRTAGGDVGKTALAFHLGKSPEQLSTSELTDKGNKDYGQAALKFSQLSHAREGMGPDDRFNYTVNQEGTLLDARIKQAARAQAANMGGTHGQNRCAEGVQLSMAHAGDKSLLGSGNGRAMDRALRADPNLVCVDRNTAFAAIDKGHVAIVTRAWTAERIAAHSGKDYGHIEILMNDGGKIMGASDYYGAHRVQNSAYNWQADHFYLPKVDIHEG